MNEKLKTLLETLIRELAALKAWKMGRPEEEWRIEAELFDLLKEASV